MWVHERESRCEDLSRMGRSKISTRSKSIAAVEALVTDYSNYTIPFLHDCVFPRFLQSQSYILGGHPTFRRKSKNAQGAKCCKNLLKAYKMLNSKRATHMQ